MFLTHNFNRMILLNTTFIVHKSIERDFVYWIHETYIPAAEESGIFSDSILSRIMTQTDPEGTNYAVQMRAVSHDLAEKWHDCQAADLKNEIARTWGQKVLHFTTFMEILNR